MEHKDFQLFQQVLTSFRWEIMEKLVQVGSNPKFDLSAVHEHSATLRGAVMAIDHILSGGLDTQAENVLGLSTDPGPPMEPYMPEEES
jgi:hypothetical protein